MQVWGIGFYTNLYVITLYVPHILGYSLQIFNKWLLVESFEILDKKIKSLNKYNIKFLDQDCLYYTCIIKSYVLE